MDNSRLSTVLAIPRRPWFWAFAASALAYFATLSLTEGRGGGELLSAALTFASFSAIVGLGQMFVITLGPGNVDLSIPATMTPPRATCPWVLPRATSTTTASSTS